MTNLLLSIELVPSSSWYSNVRSNVSKKEWENIQKYVFTKANYKCEICGGIGNKHPVECHEIWEYDDIKQIQKLSSCIALCPKCHRVKHYGFAITQGLEKTTFNWFCKINNLDEISAKKYIKEVFIKFYERSKHRWELNLDWLKTIQK